MLDIEYVPINSIKAYENNAKIHTFEQIEQIKKSIEEFGMNDLIGIWRDEIVEGHGRLIACKELGFEEVPIIRLDTLTDEQRKAYAMVHNKLTMNTDFDVSLLMSELDEVGKYFDMSDYGFEFFEEKSEEDIENEQIKEAIKTLADDFIVPPLSILDCRQGYWSERKKAWKKVIGDNGDAREGGNKLLESRNRFLKKIGNKSMRANSSVTDPVLCEVLVTWFLPKKGEETLKCFDCFSGDTTFGFVSSYLGNSFCGTELREKQVDFNQNAVNKFGLDAKYICDDARNIDKYIEPKSQDLFFSCPPYYDMEVYSDKESDASNQKTYEEFYAILDEAFTKSCTLLKENRFAVIVCQDVRDKKRGYYYNFPSDIINTFRKNGFALYNKIILIRQSGSASYFARRNMNSARKATTVHEEVLVFFNGEESDLFATEEDVVNEFYKDYLRKKQNILVHDEVLVFYRGDEKEIKNEYGKIERKKSNDES